MLKTKLDASSFFLHCHPGLVLFDHLELQFLRGHDPRMGTASPSRITIPSYRLLFTAFPPRVLCGFENLVRVLDAFCGRGLRVLQRVVDFEFLVLA